MLKTAIDLMERGYVPDGLTRIGIRQLLLQRLRAEDAHDEQVRAATLERLITEMRASIKMGSGLQVDKFPGVP